MATLTVADAAKILADNFAPWVLDTGARVDAAGPETARLRIPFADKLCRVGGIMCGQAIIAGADTAMVLAIAATAGGFKPCTTVDLTINYMRPVTRADAVIDAKVVRLGKTLAFCTCEILGEGGKIAAFSTGTYAILA